MKPAQVVLAIRIAMMTGVLLFGGVSWYLHRAPDWAPPSAALVESLSSVARIVWILVALALVVLFLKGRNAADFARAVSLAILAWSLGEMLALYGGVVFFMTADAGWYWAGITALSITFVAFPPPERR